MTIFRNTVLTMSMICLGLPMFTSCEENEVQEWELTELELTPTEDFDIPYKGGNQTFSFKTNNSWKVVSSGDWVTFDKASGTGDATITATFAENSTIDNRKAVIRVISGEEPTPNNYVGVVTQTISTLQHSNYQDRIDAISVKVKESICDSWTEYGNNNRRYFYDVKASLEVNTNDKNTNELILKVGADLCYTEYYHGYYNDRSTAFTFDLGNDYDIEWTDGSGYSNYVKVEGYRNLYQWKKFKDYSNFSLKPFIIFKNPDGSQRAKVYYDEVPVKINKKD